MTSLPRRADIVPGLILTLVVAAIARLAHGMLPKEIGDPVGEVIVAVLLGLVVGNLVPLPKGLASGIKFSFHTLLRVAIVLLGARFSFQQVAAIGGKALIMIVVLMSLALAVSHGLGRLAGISGRLASLIGVGTAVCGNSAITATAPVIHASDEEVSFAVATNTLFGTLAVFVYPILGHFLGFPDAVFGTWAGTAVNDTSQVVATGFAYSEAAGKVATAVKLTRNALMGGVIVLMGLLHSRERAGEGPRASFGQRLKQSVPLFVVVFLGMAVLNSFGVFAALSTATGRDLQNDMKTASGFLILVALTGVGLGTRLASLRKIGLAPLYIGFATAAATSLASLLLIKLLGPAGG
ncbi:MAG: putative sulfate exporter family transporter [Acidobacteria bacterium]|nr:putative sulfate exporter family transporter [Acidobacteriota bacterium]